MRLDEVVGGPLQLVECRIELPGRHIGRAVFDDAPGEHGCGGCHRQAEFDVIAGVVPAAGQVAADIRAVLQRGVAAPVDAVGGGQISGALSFIEEQRFLQGLTVVEGLCEELRREQRHERHPKN
jgi:hypothetical protein